MRAGTGCDPRTLTRNGYSALTARAPAAELADARAALRWLAARFPGRPLLTVGHSEGTWHAARLAAEEEQVAGTVLLSAPAGTGEEVIEWQIAAIEPTLPGRRG